MRPLRVVGLDLSLTSTGASDTRTTKTFQTGPGALIEMDEPQGPQFLPNGNVVPAEADKSFPVEGRLNFLVMSCVDFVLGDRRSERANLVVIEGAAYGARGDAVDQLAGLRWLVRCALWRRDVPVAVVAPTSLKKYTTGSGRAGKAQMVAGVRERYGHNFSPVRIKDGRYDMADAFALAAMGLAAKGRSLALDGQPERNENLRAVTWPALLSDD